MRRGDLLTVSLQGDQGKPRPALVVQVDQFAELAAVIVLPVTSTLLDAPLLRISVEPDAGNGLVKPSQIMIDKPQPQPQPQPQPRSRLGPVFGHLDDVTMLGVSRALALFLGLA